MGSNVNGKISQEIIEYIGGTLWAELATVREDGSPVVRTIGAFALDNGGSSIYFATLPNADKTRQIEANNRVSFFFQHEGQQLHEFRNAEVIGSAAKIDADDKLERAVRSIAERSPFVREHIEKNGVGTFGFYEVTASEIKFLDYRKGIGPEAIETVIL
ncbi:pyridoxamine 5'-phosphate oxidase family protein [Geobacter pickeringii]|uniref:Pyridoxamine 5'-phosphate oxidase N-terminal domain-containing protein n=1 Tax=Geobacter pickeringii TaxID=345632 RepID=A0A0B5B6L7_9BACT|nr:pyridoxamine 5'-phosphate oxidase family protein [Geobacter pickeringii]AJE02182.1 hypothetical protein GPICK_01245 [Geobacter pickeringii]